MKTLASALAAAAVLGLAMSGGAIAQTSGGSSSGATQMSDAECQTVWSRVNPSNAASVSETAASEYVQNFSTADADKNGQLSSSEFMQACQDGMVSSTASTGSGSGATGSGSGMTKSK